MSRSRLTGRALAYIRNTMGGTGQSAGQLLDPPITTTDTTLHKGQEPGEGIQQRRANGPATRPINMPPAFKKLFAISHTPLQAEEARDGDNSDNDDDNRPFFDADEQPAARGVGPVLPVQDAASLQKVNGATRMRVREYLIMFDENPSEFLKKIADHAAKRAKEWESKQSLSVDDVSRIVSILNVIPEMSERHEAAINLIREMKSHETKLQGELKELEKERKSLEGKFHDKENGFRTLTHAFEALQEEFEELSEKYKKQIANIGPGLAPEDVDENVYAEAAKVIAESKEKRENVNRPPLPEKPVPANGDNKRRSNKNTIRPPLPPLPPGAAEAEKRQVKQKMVYDPSSGKDVVPSATGRR